ncbi:beta-lactamase family protein [Belnapia sp. T6]|uniref:Beta-lactamase family protein n=1 Tax=Belnapia mucosa TaxID=2804532 RepID=A0ABS1VCD3_9PROT|nr:serine hydrolase domain-containing protein [Belnapia mucosa]MBL6458048.1 beta-lactamase family protein [Belnapia mucosa]
MIDEILSAAVARGDVVGAAATVGNAAGTLYEGAAGFRGGEAPMAADTVAWIASMTKAITSVAALQQVEAGRLSLDGPIAEVLPELAAPQVLEGFTESGEPILRPARGAITLRQLLTHTAGFGYDTWQPKIGRYAKLRGIPPMGSCRRLALTAPLIADPGTAWNYGIGIDWAGLAVEAVTGRRLGEAIREGITGPLGMVDTGFRLGEAQRARLSAMHARGADGSLTPIRFEVPQEPEFEMGGGGLYGTARDYLCFCRMVLNGGTLDGARILSPETAAALGQNQMGTLLVQRMESCIPGASHHAEFFPGQPKRWSLAFMLNEAAHPEGGRAAGSMAWAGLGNTYYWIDPLHDRAGVLVTQSLPFADPRVLALLADFERAVYAA